jgi:hypothetical protein
MRKRLKANVTQTVINRLAKQLIIANNNGVCVDECLSECILRNWRGFDYSWLNKSASKSNHDLNSQNYQSGKF